MSFQVSSRFFLVLPLPQPNVVPYGIVASGKTYEFCICNCCSSHVGNVRQHIKFIIFHTIRVKSYFSICAPLELVVPTQIRFPLVLHSTSTTDWFLCSCLIGQRMQIIFCWSFAHDNFVWIEHLILRRCRWWNIHQLACGTDFQLYCLRCCKYASTGLHGQTNGKAHISSHTEPLLQQWQVLVWGKHVIPCWMQVGLFQNKAILFRCTYLTWDRTKVRMACWSILNTVVKIKIQYQRHQQCIFFFF